MPRTLFGSDDCRDQSLENNGAIVLRAGPYIQVRRRISLIRGATGTTDTTAWFSPAVRMLVQNALIIRSQTITGTSPSFAVSLGITTGGVELITSNTLGSSVYGYSTSERGTAVFVGASTNWDGILLSNTVSFRDVLTSSSATGGEATVFINGFFLN